MQRQIVSRGKERYLEIQMQFKMRSVPKDQIHFGLELDDVKERGMIQHAIVTTTMTFLKTRNHGLTYDYCGEEEQSDGQYVKPHVYIPLETLLEVGQ